MNYITLFPIFGSRRSQWIFCFRAEHLCFSPWFREQFSVWGWCMDDSQWHIWCWQQAPPRKPRCTLCSGLCLSKIWAWGCTESGGARLTPGPHQSASWHQNWSVTALSVRVHPYTCEKFHELFYFKFSFSFSLLFIMIYMFYSIFDAFWASFGLALWNFFFFKAKQAGLECGLNRFPRRLSLLHWKENHFPP